MECGNGEYLAIFRHVAIFANKKAKNKALVYQLPYRHEAAEPCIAPQIKVYNGPPFHFFNLCILRRISGYN